MKTYYILVGLLCGCNANCNNLQERWLTAAGELKVVSQAAKYDLQAAARQRSGSRGFVSDAMQKFDAVSHALEKMEGLAMTLEIAAKSFSIPGLESLSEGFIPQVRYYLRMGKSALDSVVYAQKQLANGLQNTDTQNLSGKLSAAKSIISSLIGLFRGKMRSPGSVRWDLGLPGGQELGYDPLGGQGGGYGSSALAGSPSTGSYFNPSTSSFYPSMSNRGSAAATSQVGDYGSFRYHGAGYGLNNKSSASAATVTGLLGSPRIKRHFPNTPSYNPSNSGIYTKSSASGFAGLSKNVQNSASSAMVDMSKIMPHY